MDETLISAARRVVRFFNIDQAHGGLVSVDTLQAVHTLDVMVSRASDKEQSVSGALRTAQQLGAHFPV